MSNPCGKQVYMGTLEEMAQREAEGISGPDPCAEVEQTAAPVDVVSTNGHVSSARKFQIGDKVRIHGGLPWTIAGDDTDSPHTLDKEPAYKLTQTSIKTAHGYQYDSVLTRYARESDLVPVA